MFSLITGFFRETGVQDPFNKIFNFETLTKYSKPGYTNNGTEMTKLGVREKIIRFCQKAKNVLKKNRMIPTVLLCHIMKSAQVKHYL